MDSTVVLYTGKSYFSERCVMRKLPVKARRRALTQRMAICSVGRLGDSNIIRKLKLG